MVALGGWGMCGSSRGACIVAPGGACVVAPAGVGHAWLLRGGMHGCSGGACMVAPRGACMGYDEIR